MHQFFYPFVYSQKSINDSLPFKIDTDNVKMK